METVASVVDLNERIDALTAIDIGRRDVDAEVRGADLTGDSTSSGPLKQFIRSPIGGGFSTQCLKIDTLVALALTEARANHKAEARTILRDAMKVARLSSPSPDTTAASGTITKALVKAGATGEASRIANIFGETDRNIRFYC